MEEKPSEIIINIIDDFKSLKRKTDALIVWNIFNSCIVILMLTGVI